MKQQQKIILVAAIGIAAALYMFIQTPEMQQKLNGETVKLREACQKCGR